MNFILSEKRNENFQIEYFTPKEQQDLINNKKIVKNSGKLKNALAKQK